ncbi:protein transport protein SEC16B [Populus alba x Populus x berolinensis]|uniref:Protein transport protein sec16 n=1 Tax=Populus alba x Populus x berolinensis TaxID=444605 RepID=A0AAD6RNN5_9ROSI|nr:protein transport protein SEC16B [Populus alba x Populus x berolinensis]
MATNPPFNVMEDQTDEDFFDKLVDDDFGPPDLDSGPKFTEGSDSDEAKAFANLSIEDTKGGFEGKVENDGAGLDGVKAEESNALESGNSLGSSDGVIESNNDGIGSEVVPETTVCQSSGSLKSGVKEVGWGSFYADSADNGNHGFGSSSDFFNDFGGGSEDFPANIVQSASNVENRGGGGLDNSVSYEQYQDGSQVYGGSVMESVNGQDLSSSQYWENMYPGWKHDANTGQWYQVDAFDATASMQGSVDGALGVECVAASASFSDGKAEVNYLQQTSQSVVGTVAETSTTESVSSWNQVSVANNNGYPEHMVFDPQYPGWYYDTMVGEWRSLDSYTPSAQSTTVQTIDRQNQNGFAFSNPYSPNSSSMNAEYGQAEKYGYQGYNSQGLHGSGGESYGSYNQQGLNMWQPQTAAKTDTISNFGGNQQLENLYGSNVSMNNHVDQQNAFNYSGTVPSYDKASQGYAEANGFVGSQSFVHGGNFSQKSNKETVKQNEQAICSNDYFSSQKQASVPHQSFQSNQQFSYAPNTGRSSAGRPPHALVTFGFGGKLIVMKDSSSLRKTSFSSQDHVGGSISVMNLMEIILGSSDNASSVGGGTCSYFHALCQQSFPGPLVGGNVGNKELNKWIDERIAHSESLGVNHRKGEVLRLLLALLKIACQHYGKLRSPFGTDNLLKESDAPESAVAKLFASAKKNSTHFSEYGALDHCLQNMPSEGQIRATASEVQHLLVSGRKKEALQCAQEGQLWGPALVLASQLGDQYYVDTVKLMALHQLVAGSPLRTLCLLIAGQPAEVFSTDSNVHGGFPGDLSIPQQPVQFGANRMLDDWEENLAVITANRTKDDELVLMHLGDCLWKDRSELDVTHSTIQIS